MNKQLVAHCQRLIIAPGHTRGTLFLLTRNRPCYCIFILLQIIDNYVFSDLINIITQITTRIYYDNWQILVIPTKCFLGLGGFLFRICDCEYKLG